MKKRTVALLAGAMLMMAAGSASALQLTLSDGNVANQVFTVGSGITSSLNSAISAVENPITGSFTFDGFTITTLSGATQHNPNNSIQDTSAVT
jgi:hypothetical protein